jgi:hypothetical protein
VLVALLALAAIPGALEAARQLHSVTMPQAVGGAAVACTLLGFVALTLARRARREAEWRLGGLGGESTARVGQLLGAVALCAGLTAGLTLALFGVLLLLG